MGSHLESEGSQGIHCSDCMNIVATHDLFQIRFLCAARRETTWALKVFISTSLFPIRKAEEHKARAPSGSRPEQHREIPP
jgi:hypothetical protein